jgi:hypothetical protein
MEENLQKGWCFDKSGDPLIMGYFDNLDNGSLNKYKKILKMENNL